MTSNKSAICEECIKSKISLIKSEEKIEKLKKKCQTLSDEIKNLKSQLKNEANKHYWIQQVTNVRMTYNVK